MSNLRLQGSTYHARLTVPKDVRSKFQGKAELSQSLQTGNLKLAKVRVAETVAAWKRQIAIAREGNPAIVVSEWSKAWGKELRNADHSNGGMIQELDSPFGAPPTIQEVYYPSHKDLVEFVMQDEAEELVNSGQLLEEEVKGAIEVARGEKVPLLPHRGDYLKQYSTHSIKTQAAYSAALDHFLERFKEERQVTTKSLKVWLTFLAEDKALAVKTITRLLGTARTFWEYLVENEIVIRDSNPWSGVKLSIPKTATKTLPYLPFSPQKMTNFLQAPVTKNDPQLTMLITIAMYTGARIEEIAMLRKSDIDATDETLSIRGTKTNAAYRVVPIHPVLLPLFSALPAIDSEDQGFVIPGLTIDKRGERGKALGKRFGRLKKAMGFTGRQKCFHSIRKTVATQFEQAEVPEGVAADILGHEKQTMTYGLYSGGSSIQQKKEAIHKLKYPEPLGRVDIRSAV